MEIGIDFIFFGLCVCVLMWICVDASSSLTPWCEWQLLLIVKTGQRPNTHSRTHTAVMVVRCHCQECVLVSFWPYVCPRSGSFQLVCL